MLRAPISGLRRAMWPTRCSIGMPTAPVEKLMMMLLRWRISSMIPRYFSTLKLGSPSSSRAWMCTTAAPASAQRRASSAISTGVYGMYSHWLRVVRAPVRAAVITTRSRPMLSIPLLILCGPLAWPLDNRRQYPLRGLQLRIMTDVLEPYDVGSWPALFDYLRHVRTRHRVRHPPDEADWGC